MKYHLPSRIKHKGFQSLLVFGVVGVAATFVHVGVGLMLTESGLARPFAANSIAFSCAFLVSYVGHYFYTFQSSLDNHLALPRFLIVALLGLFLNQLIVFAVVNHLEHSYLLALVLVTTLVPIVTYVAGRCWVFNASRGNTPTRIE